MTCKHEAMGSLQQNAQVEIGKGTAVEGVISRAFRALKNITNVPIYVNCKNVAASESAMNAGRKQKSELANNLISPGKENGEAVDYVSKASNSLSSKPSAHKSALITPNKVSYEAQDIDSCDADDQLAFAEYAEDLYKFYKIVEESSQIRDYMRFQVEINAEMRANLSNWLIKVHEEYQLMPETLYLSFQIMDRYLSVQTVRRRKLRLVGISSLLIACKYEETRGSSHVVELACISKMVFRRSKILRMEKEILNKLDWSLTIPTMYVFLVRFMKAACGDEQMEQMAFFFSELALMNYSMAIYKPSMVAASAVYAARCSLKIPPFWTETLEHHTGFKSYQLVNCARELVSFQASEEAADRMKAKYSVIHYDALALNAPGLKILEIIRTTLVRLFEKNL